MPRVTLLRVLLLLNVVLAGAVLLGLHKREVSASPSELSTAGISPEERTKSKDEQPGARQGLSTHRAPSTFAIVYSADPKSFAANLRAIGCPEETVKDILIAELHRRFKDQEQALRPTPADHVPFMWSAQTTEPRLLERREEAAALSREKSAMLRDALGCVPSVPMPLYAMTSGDQQFEEMLARSPQLDACSIRQVHDTYWSDVNALLQQTKGFWLPEDVAQLELLKERHRKALSQFVPGQ